jgi:hypothetical protein
MIYFRNKYRYKLPAGVALVPIENSHLVLKWQLWDQRWQNTGNLKNNHSKAETKAVRIIYNW